MIPTVLTVAGSDSSGGAGIQADLKAIAACGGYGASVVTAVTAQNTCGVRAAEPLSESLVRAQLDAVFDDLEVRGVKTGMLATAGLVGVVADALRERRPPLVVCDPVMVAKSGDRLLCEDAIDAIRRRLLPWTTLLTPNVPEAEALTGRPVRTLGEAEAAARALLDLGATAVLIKGGHLDGPLAVDLLGTRDGFRRFAAERLPARHTHGTGCTLAAAIATHLALGRSLEDAVAEAKTFVTEAIRHGFAVGRGVGPTDPFWAMRAPGSRAPGRSVLRLHVLVGDAVVAAAAAEEGADVVQVRDKESTGTAARVALVRAALLPARARGVRVVVNDRADVAAEAGADGVHLGRHDLSPAVARHLLGEQALIGGTANSLEEALALAPSAVDYLGVGPVFDTRTKANPAPTLGLAGLAAIARAVDKPVIAIGGITAERVAAVLDAGAAGVAVASAVAAAEDPREAVRALRRAIDAHAGSRGEGVHAERA